MDRGNDYQYYLKYRNRYRALTGTSLAPIPRSHYHQAGGYYLRGKQYKQAYRQYQKHSRHVGGSAVEEEEEGSFSCDLRKLFQREFMHEFSNLSETCNKINMDGSIKIKYRSVQIGDGETAKKYITSFTLDNTDANYKIIKEALSKCSYNTYGFTASGEIKKTPFPFILNTCVLGSMLKDVEGNNRHLLGNGHVNGIIANIGHGDVYEANLVTPTDGGVLRYAIAKVGDSWRYCTRVGNLGYGRGLFDFKTMVEDNSDGKSENRLAKFRYYLRHAEAASLLDRENPKKYDKVFTPGPLIVSRLVTSIVVEAVLDDPVFNERLPEGVRLTAFPFNDSFFFYKDGASKEENEIGAEWEKTANLAFCDAVYRIFGPHFVARRPFTAVYKHGNGKEERVTVVKEPPFTELERGGFTVFIPSLRSKHVTEAGQLRLLAQDRDMNREVCEAYFDTLTVDKESLTSLLEHHYIHCCSLLSEERQYVMEHSDQFLPPNTTFPWYSTYCKANDYGAKRPKLPQEDVSTPKNIPEKRLELTHQIQGIMHALYEAKTACDVATELYEQATTEVDKSAKEAGKKSAEQELIGAVNTANVHVTYDNFEIVKCNSLNTYPSGQSI